MRIEIKVSGHLDKQWKEWFDNLEIKYEGENTVLTGEIADQAALHGLIIKIRDLNLKLISIDSENHPSDHPSG
jgi:hypothetical protein